MPADTFLGKFSISHQFGGQICFLIVTKTKFLWPSELYFSSLSCESLNFPSFSWINYEFILFYGSIYIYLPTTSGFLSFLTMIFERCYIAYFSIVHKNREETMFAREANLAGCTFLDILILNRNCFVILLAFDTFLVLFHNFFGILRYSLFTFSTKFHDCYVETLESSIFTKLNTLTIERLSFIF